MNKQSEELKYYVVGMAARALPSATAHQGPVHHLLTRLRRGLVVVLMSLLREHADEGIPWGHRTVAHQELRGETVIARRSRTG